MATRVPSEEGKNIGADENLQSRVSLLLSLIHQGDSISEAQRRAGISVEQLTRGLEQNPAAAEELETTMRRLQREAWLRLLSLIHEAVDVVERALEREDAEVAISLLSLLGSSTQRGPARRSDELTGLVARVQEMVDAADGRCEEQDDEGRP